MLSDKIDFEIKRLNTNLLPDELFVFTEKCQAQGIKNNSSVEEMKLGKWGTEAWWCTWHNGNIISISGCHKFDIYEVDCWRLMVRTATLKEYRGRAPGNFRLIKNDFNWGHILPYQIEYALANGARKLVFTTNSSMDGDANSVKTNRLVSKVLEPQGLVKLIDENKTIFYVTQNVWEIIC